MDWLLFLLLLLQAPFVLVLVSRLITAPRRIPPLQPLPAGSDFGARVSIIIPTLNEVRRLPNCLDGLRDPAIAEVVVVDSRSTDGTREFVERWQADFPCPLRLETDDPLPSGWVGRPWALHTGWLRADPRSEWILGIDADTRPQPGLVASLVTAAIAGSYDMVSLSPRFLLETPGEQWLQPALLVTLVYRFGATGDPSRFEPDRVMANGQCFLSRRATLARLGGYASAKSSFCDDVTLARFAAQQGAKVGFLDGKNLLHVRMYESMVETWREWGRSLDLKDASGRAQALGDSLFLLATQGLPLPLLLALECFPSSSLTAALLLGLNRFLVFVRVALLFALRPSYGSVGIWFWLSPLADPLAALRIALSSVNKPKQWRGRIYNQGG